MQKRLPLVLLLSVLLFAASTVSAQYVYTASGRMVRTQEALTAKSGALTFYTHLDYNTVTGAYVGNLGSVVAHSILRNSIHLDYAINNNITLAINPLIYQDTHFNDGSTGATGGNALEHIIVALKGGSFGFVNDYFYVGGMATVMIPISNRFNSFGNPYTAGGTEIGINLLLSYYADNLFPKEAFNVNANVGFYTFLDQGKNISNNLTNRIEVASTSSAINYSLGFKYPTTAVDLMLEVWGWAFINQPPSVAYTRESMTFVTVAGRLKPVDFLAFTLGFDYQITGRDDQTDYIAGAPFSILRRPPNSPTNYTEWRLILGLQFNILPLSFGSAADPSLIDFTTGSQGSDIILRKLEDIGEDKESTARKIEELRRRRQDIEKNLQQLRNILKEGEPAKKEEPKQPEPPKTEPKKEEPKQEEPKQPK
ncbi:MAG: hypothetical protein HY22_02780 [[Candidatus Thermochlorobacteriaceae] bacterium GBChlB]|nr:MAG: hypothetical protein HY22_02780 [[Candidatus Thermochlorobacteriaceae] bacterium GBChlB]